MYLNQEAYEELLDRAARAEERLKAAEDVLADCQGQCDDRLNTRIELYRLEYEAWV